MGHRAYLVADRSRAALERFRPLAAAVGVVIVILVVGWWLLRPAAPPVDASLPMARPAEAPAAGGAAAGPSPGGVTGSSTGPGATTSTIPATIVAQAAGAVVRPGVYDLPVGGRVVDLVEAAGGLAPTADRERINLASAVADGQRVWIPSVGETTVPEVVAGAEGPTPGPAPLAGGSGGGGGNGASAAATPSAPVDLNTATAEQLDTLPGVGPATAAAILAHREATGGFRSVDDLLDVRGIGEAKLEQLRPMVRV